MYIYIYIYEYMYVCIYIYIYIYIAVCRRGRRWSNKVTRWLSAAQLTQD